MTEQQWKEEVAMAVHGLPWAVVSAGCAQDRATCFAHLTQGTESKQVKLSLETFYTPEARKAEIIRQVKHT